MLKNKQARMADLFFLSIGKTYKNREYLVRFTVVNIKKVLYNKVSNY